MNSISINKDYILQDIIPADRVVYWKAVGKKHIGQLYIYKIDHSDFQLLVPELGQILWFQHVSVVQHDVTGQIAVYDHHSATLSLFSQEGNIKIY